RFVPLDDLLQTSDAVSIHVPLTEQTRGLIGARELGLMKAGALLVNTARGAIVDTAALAANLKSGHQAGATSDEFAAETVPPHHPLLACEQLGPSAHNADQTPEGVDILNDGAVDNVTAFLQGKPQNRVV